MTKTFPDKDDAELIEAFSTLKTPKEIENFLRDLMTLSEINEMSRRFQIAKLLWSGYKSYLEIAKKMKTSTTTVTRVAAWLFKQPSQGYRTVLSRLYPQK